MSDREKKLLKLLRGLRSRKINDQPVGAELAAGYAGNVDVETGGTFDPSEKQGSGEKFSDEKWFKSSRGGRGTGLFQWDDRRHALKKFAEDRGKEWDDLDTQLDFWKHELEGSESKARKKAEEGETPEEVAELVSKYYERPGIPHIEKRKKSAREIFDKHLKPEIEAKGKYLFGAPVDEEVPELLDPKSAREPMFQDGGVVAPSRMATPDEYNYIKLLKKAKEQGSQIVPDPEAALDNKTVQKLLRRAKPLSKKVAGLAGPIGAGLGAALLSGDAQAGLGELLGSDAVGEGSDEIPGRAMPISPAEMKEAKEKYAPLVDSPELLKQYRELMTKETKKYADGGVTGMEDLMRQLTGNPEYTETETPVLDMVEEANVEIPETPLNQKREPMSEVQPETVKTEDVKQPEVETPKSKKSSELDLRSKYEQLLSQLEKPRTTEKSDDMKKAEWMDAISSIAGSLDRYGREPRTPGRQTQFAKQLAAREAKSTGMDALKQRASILKQLQDLKKGSKSGFSNDPKSAESLNMAKKFKKLYGVDYGGMSEAAMVKAFPGLVSTDRAKFLEKGKESRHKQRFEFKENETEAKRMEKIVSDFNSDPIMRDSKKAIIAADKAETIIKKGGKLAPAVMGRLLARMAGEVGVMTDQDVAAFKGSPQWTDSLQRWFKRGISGKLTKTDKQEMLKMVNNLRTVERAAIAGYADTLSKQYSNASGLSRKRIMSSILPKESSELFEVSDKVKIQAPNGETRLVDKESVQKYLDKGGKIIED